MKKFTILKHPHPFLKKVTQAVAENKIDDILCHTINIMFNTMYESHGGGLAANQVGLDMRIFIMDNSTEKNQPIVALNPEILEKSGCVHEEEACLSFP